MPGFARTRIQDNRGHIVGSYFNEFNTPKTQNREASPGEVRTMQDIVGNKNSANMLLLMITKTATPTLSGEYKINNVVYRRFTSCPIGYTPVAPGPNAEYPDPSFSVKNAFAWDILAKSNPSSAVVSLPTFLAELKDIPSMIRDLGTNILKKNALKTAASSHLTWQWFIKPLVSDFKKMLNFAKAVDDRVALFRHLQKKGFTSQRTSGGSTSVTYPPVGVYVHSEGATVYCLRTTTYTSKVWGSAKWKVSSRTILPTSSLEMRKYAERICAGITRYEVLKTAWELLPWSWLADWFLGLGKVLAAQQDTVGLDYSNLCMMRTSTARNEYVVVKGPQTSDWVTLSGSHFEESTYKQRWLVAPILPVAVSTLPFLSERCWSILGSIAALKGKIK